MINELPIILNTETIRNRYLSEIHPLRRWIDVHTILRRNTHAGLSLHGIMILAAALKNTFYRLFNILSCKIKKII